MDVGQVWDEAHSAHSHARCPALASCCRRPRRSPGICEQPFAPVAAGRGRSAPSTGSTCRARMGAARMSSMGHCVTPGTCSTSTSGRSSPPRSAAGCPRSRARAGRCSRISAALSWRRPVCRPVRRRTTRSPTRWLRRGPCRSPTSARARVQRRRGGSERGREGVLAVRAAHHASSRLSRVHRLRRPQLARASTSRRSGQQPV